MRHPRSFALLTLALLAGCVSAPRESLDADANYALVFSSVRQPRPVILHSRLERYAKSLGPLQSAERNGEWEFELLVPCAWVDEVLPQFKPVPFDSWARRPTASWWTPTAADYDAYEMPYTSYPAAHLFVEKHPADPSRIHVFIQRH